jgi:type III secretion system FlhB-like substrate exporter
MPAKSTQTKRRYKNALVIGSNAQSASNECILAKGEFADADQIVRIARRLGKTVIEHPQAAAALAPLEVDEVLPPALQRALRAIVKALTGNG